MQQDAKKIKERDVERYLCRKVKEMGGEVRKVQWIGRRGAPDRLVMLQWEYHDMNYNLTIWVELKAPGKKPEPHQVREHKRMRELGQWVEVIDSFEAVDALLG